MTSFPFTAARAPGILATVLVHAALSLGWQLARTLPPALAEAESPAMQWIRLPPPALDEHGAEIRSWLAEEASA